MAQVKDAPAEVRPEVQQRQYTPELMVAARDEFAATYPGYSTTARLDELRRTDYARLGDGDQIYLDYTGGGLYAESQLRRHMELLTGNVFGNPHSSNPTSQAATRLVDSARAYVLEFFNASPDEYLVIFTANASGALKLLGEAYPFAPGGRYMLAADDHNSVVGIREFARARGAEIEYCPVRPPELRLDADCIRAALTKARPDQHNLFAYPAQSNFSGVQHSLDWIAEAQALGWDVLLDSAAFAPTNRLDLGRVHPDFVSLSFYKIFGYPTGIGALIARRATLSKLRRPWYAGGTITTASVEADGHYLAAGVAGFEDGTVNYLGIPAVEIGLRHIAAIGIETIHERVVDLTGWLLRELTNLRHSNGRPVIIAYGPATTEQRGGTITFNFLDPAGQLVDPSVIEQQANAAQISLRSGCYCNPGSAENALGITRPDIIEFFHRKTPITPPELISALAAKSFIGFASVRVSLGLVSTFEDVYRFMAFATRFVDKPAAAWGEVPTNHHPTGDSGA